MRARSSVWVVIGALLMLSLLELVLRFLPVNTGPQQVDGGGADTVENYRPNSEFTWSRDWDFLYARHGTVNQLGYPGVCSLSNDAEHGAWVFGDSFVETVMTEPGQTFSGQVAAAQPEMKVCALGMSGASAPEYLAMLDFVSQRGKARHWIIVLTEGDFAEAYTARAGLHYFARSADGRLSLAGDKYHRGWAVKVLASSRLLQYLNYNLGFKEQLLRRFHCIFSVDGCAKGKSADAHFPLKVADEAALAFADQLAGRAQQLGAKPIIVLNHFRRTESAQETAERRQHWLDVTAMMQARGFRVIDALDVMPDSDSGGCNGTPCVLFRDRHWTPAGSKALMTAIGPLH